MTSIGGNVANRGKESIGHVLHRHVWMLRSDNTDVSQCAFRSMTLKVKGSSYIVKLHINNLLGIDASSHFSMHIPRFLFCSLHIQGPSLIVVDLIFV